MVRRQLLNLAASNNNQTMVYDRLAKRYDRLMAPLERLFLARWRMEAIRLLPSDALILEVGAGTGANFPNYPAETHIVASEPATEMIDRASERARTIRLVQASVEDLPFASSTFDAAFATLVFCSVCDPSRGFHELRRVVRPGGSIVLLEHVRPDGLLGYAFDAINVVSTRLIEDHFNRPTADTARDAGLEIVEVRRKGFGVFNLIVLSVGTV